MTSVFFVVQSSENPEKYIKKACRVLEKWTHVDLNKIKSAGLTRENGSIIVSLQFVDNSESFLKTLESFQKFRCSDDKGCRWFITDNPYRD